MLVQHVSSSLMATSRLVASVSASVCMEMASPASMPLHAPLTSVNGAKRMEMKKACAATVSVRAAMSGVLQRHRSCAKPAMMMLLLDRLNALVAFTAGCAASRVMPFLDRATTISAWHGHHFSQNACAITIRRW